MTDQHPYDNQDPRCGYPSPDPGDKFDYCWSFAHHIDGTKGYEDMGKICPGCELFDEGREANSQRAQRQEGDDA